MEGLTVRGFVFGVVGVVAFAKVETNKNLKRKRNSRTRLQRRVIPWSMSLEPCKVRHVLGRC